METAIRKEHFLHPDFNENFKSLLCEYLNSLIDEELEKEDADFDFIDECASVINAVREDTENVILSFASEKEFMKNFGIRKGRNYLKIFTAVCAAVAVVVALNTAVEKTTDVNIIRSASNWVQSFFEKEETTLPTTTEAESTTKKEIESESHTEAPIIQAESIELKFTDAFKREYEVGEILNLNGLIVSISYSDETVENLKRSQYEISVSPDFGKEAGYETVTVKCGNLEESFTVRVINTEKTSLLSSVYAVFPDSFTFTSDDLTNIDLKSMQVFAVFSDGTEKELSSSEYELIFENLSDDTEEKVMVTVKYKTTSCSFMVFKE